jgi:hypothetical protein
MTAIEILSITGLNNPYFIEVCDVYGSNCILLSQVFTTVPPAITLYLPPPFSSAPAVMIKITTLDGCVKTQIIDCNELNPKQFQDLITFEFMDLIVFDFQD